MILRRASLRYLSRHPWVVVLSVLGVALGVAVVVAIDLANESAVRAFTLSVETLSGQATHQIVGGPRGLSEVTYRRLRIDAQVRTSAPVVEGHARLRDFVGQTFTLLGIDPFAEAKFRPYVSSGRDTPGLTQLLSEPATGLITRSTANRLGINAGDTLKLRIGTAYHTLSIVGLIEPTDSVTEQGLASVIVTDIATAQELLGMQGRLSWIDLIVPDDDSELTQRIQRILPKDATIIRSENRSHALNQMTRGFRVNLTALSLLALLVGMFLIYNIMTFSVIQRRELVGTLRALGVTRRQIFSQVIIEAMLIGGIGTVCGIALGIALGSGLVERVVRTINDLYFVVSVSELTVSPLSLLKGVAVGMGATLLAALAPAWEATGAPVSTVLQRSAVESRATRRAPRVALAGFAVVVLGIGLLAIPSRSLVLGFSALFVLVAGFVLVVPAATVWLMRGLKPVMGTLFGLLGRLATRGVVAALSRTSVAIAALAVAISATVGVGIMIDSFRQSFLDWLTASLRADIYVAAPVAQTGPSAATLDEDFIARVSTLPQVAAISTGRRVRLDGPRGVQQLLVSEVDREQFRLYQLKHGDVEQVWQAFENEGAVLVSEPYAYRHDVGLGDTISLRTNQGERPFTIAGIYYDYGSDEGRVSISRNTYNRYWNDRKVTFIRIYTQPAADISALMKQLRNAAGEHDLFIRSNQALREASIQVFDRTFAITNILRLLATIVAFVGVLSALMALQLERAREFAVLRANGLTPRQVWQLAMTETGLMGFCSGLFALPLGIGTALALILVINRRSFGWTLQVSIDPSVLVFGLLLAMVAALLAALYPAFKMARTSLALALREE
ncbi:MAG: FtsX-like permease family protein [Gammaproteobacteria bacterium]|nr:FtsX-like permease family protein [Gammaproteobacteria bacterium]